MNERTNENYALSNKITHIEKQTPNNKRATEHKHISFLVDFFSHSVSFLLLARELDGSCLRRTTLLLKPMREREPKEKFCVSTGGRTNKPNEN